MPPKQPSDSFLPSGAMDSNSTHHGFGSSHNDAVPRTMPDHIPSPATSHDSPKPYSQSSLLMSNNGSPLSPPKTRSGSADNTVAALIEDWRAYTEKLRKQHMGEKAHMLADRQRADELVEEERQMWQFERDYYKSKITELEIQLGKTRNNMSSQQSTGFNSRVLSRSSSEGQRRAASNSESRSTNYASPGSIDGTAAKAVPQESGRNPDGSAFYAPAPRNPSRTFEGSENDKLRVDDINEPRDKLRVTSRNLKSSDFIKSPPQELSSASDTPSETIDIGLIQPDLEGVPIKKSAVLSTFAAKVLSPNSSASPKALSPNNRSSPRSVTNLHSSNMQDKKPSTLDVIAAPENRRLTMHAGHTPNHSITKFPIDESGNATPTQVQHPHNVSMALEDVVPTIGQELNEDPELKGKLGLNATQTPEDDEFLTQLTEKLAAEARKSESVSPDETKGPGIRDRDSLGLRLSGILDNALKDKESEESLGSLSDATKGPGMRDRDSLGLKLSGMLGTALKDKENEEAVAGPPRGDDDDTKIDDGPPLKLKPSINFGRPMGSM